MGSAGHLQQADFFQNEQVRSARCVYTPSNFARSSLLYLQEVGTLQAMCPHVSSRSGLVSYLFFIVVDGCGWVEYHASRYQLSQGDCVFVSCENGYRQSSGEDLWTLKWVHYGGSNMAGVYNKWAERGGKPVFHPASPDRFAALLDSLHQIAEGDDYIRDMLINQKLTDLNTLLMEQTVYQEGEKRPAGRGAARIDVAEVKSYIDTHYAEPLTLSSVAERFYLHKSYLARLFKKAVGFTVCDYIALVRIGKAKELLRFTDMSVENVAKDTGFSAASYFSRCFRRVEGCSPTEFRRNWIGAEASGN